MESKKELRTLCRAKRSAVEGKREKSAEIVKKALSLPQVQDADALFLFYPLKNEVDLLPIFEYAKAQKKKIAFPLCEDKDGTMSFREVDSLDALEEKSFGIMEPNENSHELLPKKAVIFLPALAIDKQGYRLGYGKGYYDRYLAKHVALNPYTVGVVYEELVFDKLPHDKYDVPCDTFICG